MILKKIVCFVTPYNTRNYLFVFYGQTVIKMELLILKALYGRLFVSDYGYQKTAMGENTYAAIGHFTYRKIGHILNFFFIFMLTLLLFDSILLI